MFEIHDQNGSLLGSIPLSEKTQNLLNAGERVTVLYHPPQLLRTQVGNLRGSFWLYKQDGQIRTDDAAAVGEYISLQAAIAAAQGQ